MKRYSLFALVLIGIILSFCGGLYSGAYIGIFSQMQAQSTIREKLSDAVTRIAQLEQLNAGEVEKVRCRLRLELYADIQTLRMFMDDGAKMDNETSEAIRVVFARAANLGN